jgi:8-hydroxy-5-deazaflavin:NADPH oxidoreductase
VIGFLGGTGPLGRGLALRLSLAGHQTVIGSRDADRASERAAELKALGGDVGGAENREVASSCEICFLTLPYSALRPTLDGLEPALGGKLVVCTVNALDFDGGPHRRSVSAGSAAEECQELLPGARVTAAFHTVSAPKLLDPDASLTGDVPVCGDDEGDRARVVALASEIGNLRGLHAGPLRHSAALEALTAMIISMNRYYRTSAGIAFTDIST